MKLDASLLFASLALLACEAERSDVAGTWRFDLDASDVAPRIREQCAKTADPTACWNEIAAEAKLEKVRFSETDATGHATWTSFAADPKGDVVFVRVPVDLVADGAGHVLAKVAGAPTGTQAEHFAKGKISQLRVELVDAKTIAIDDPKKGRLVYAKE
ncbi:MAG: hypothetical protein KIT84_17180 [Labilithrix sp.]|nr:hypothetical protein [Labilithrix sp.]MCW5812764.1 hypothetical protein [Labilithrix sp.]